MSPLESIIEKTTLLYVRVGQIEPVPSLGQDTASIITSAVPALRDGAALTPVALNLLSHLHPPLLRRQQRGAQRFYALANLRTLELCRSALPADTKIPALVTTAHNPAANADIVAASHCLTTIVHGLDVRFATQSLLHLIMAMNPSLLEELSPHFANRSTIEKWLGLNRRLKLPPREYATSQMSEARPDE